MRYLPLAVARDTVEGSTISRGAIMESVENGSDTVLPSEQGMMLPPTPMWAARVETTELRTDELDDEHLSLASGGDAAQRSTASTTAISDSIPAQPAEPTGAQADGLGPEESHLLGQEWPSTPWHSPRRLELHNMELREGVSHEDVHGMLGTLQTFATQVQSLCNRGQIPPSDAQELVGCAQWLQHDVQERFPRRGS